jgi:hypothetical protein
VELYRAELLATATNINYNPHAFSPRGKHVFFVDLKPVNGQANAHLILDGKPGPVAGYQEIVPVFSPDETRWAYTAVKVGGRSGGGAQDAFSVVDGKEVPFIGLDPIFTADNKLLTTSNPGVPSIITLPSGVSAGGKIGVAPVGGRWAGVKQPGKPGDPRTLFVDGKEVPDAPNPEEVVFSPDGKRYMAICQNLATRMRFVVIDGKKGPEYQTIATGSARFTADSSKAIYVGNTAGKIFVVVENQPSEGYVQLQGQAVAMSPRGGHYGYVVGDGSGVNQTLFVDGAAVPLDGKQVVPDSLGFSPDGSRYAFAAGKRGPTGAPTTVLVVSGQEMPGITLNDFTVPNSAAEHDWWKGVWGAPAKYYVWSHDGAHIAFPGMRAGDSRRTLFVDGKPVFVATAGIFIQFPTWTPDNKHLLFIAQEKGTERPQPYQRIFLDGAPTAARIFDFEQPTTPGLWEVGADGALQLLVFEGPVAKRYRITPEANTSIESVLANAK